MSRAILPSGRCSRLRRVVVLGFGGIGNHLMLTPALAGLKKANPAMELHVIANSRARADILDENPYISSLSVMNLNQLNGLRDYFKAGRVIRTLKPNAVIAAAGTNPVAGSLISFFSGASVRIGEDWRGRGFLYTHTVKADQRTYEAHQNIKLARCLGGSDVCNLPKIYLTGKELSEAKHWLIRRHFPNGNKILGIHPGSGKEQKWKRWEIDKFVDVATKASKRFGVKALFFIGPDEEDLLAAVESKDIGSAVIVKGNESIRKTAAKIRACDIFLSNDSGLLHIAQAVRVKTIGIFGPTSIAKNHFGEEDHKVIFKKDVLCRPCHYTRWWLACGDRRPCLNLISSDEVIRLLDSILGRNHHQPQVAESNS